MEIFEYGILIINIDDFVDVYSFSGKILNEMSGGHFKYYKYLDFESALNILGIDGWELCSVDESRYIFKRKIN